MSKKKQQAELEKLQKESEKFHEVTQEQWDFAHLQITTPPKFLDNPLLKSDFIRPDQQLLDVMMNPDYFGWTCTKLFNTAVSENGLELLPIQCAVLRELWYRPFPILIASRGFSKSFLLAIYTLLRCLFLQGRKIIITGAGFRQSKLVLAYAEQIWYNSPVFRDLCGASRDREQGPKHDVDRWWMRIGESTAVAIPIGDGCVSKGTNILRKNCFSVIEQESNVGVWGNGRFRHSDQFINNGKKPTKVITTKKGFSYNGTYNHAMKVCRNGIIDWVRTDEMIIGDRIIVDRSYRWHEGTTDISLDEAYAIGALIRDGTWTIRGRIGFTTKDYDFIPMLEKGLGKSCKPSCNKVDFYWYGLDFYDEFIKKWDFIGPTWAKDKKIPDKILRSSREIMTACIQGLMDTDGCILISQGQKKSMRICFTNTSLKLIDQLHFILLHYGIIARKSKTIPKNPKWNIKYDLIMDSRNAKKYIDEIGFRIKRKKDISEQSESLNYKNGENIPFVKDDMTNIIRSNPAPRFSLKYKKFSSRITHGTNIGYELINKFLDTYGFSNDYRLEKIKTINNPDIFYDEIISIKNSESDTYDIHVPDGNEYCANGFFSHNSKIRGQRAHDIISDEFASISPQIFEEVIAGFGVVNIDPVSQVKHRQRMEYLKSNNASFPAEQNTTSNILMSNQMILSGTASFAFNHFCTYWKKHKNIILSQGNPSRMAELGIDTKLDYKKYSIIRIPVDLLPPGFMDQAQIDRSKATLAVGIYTNEFGACFSDDSNGFFRRSILDKAMPSVRNPIVFSNGTSVEHFTCLLKGYSDKQYIMAIDPASQRDNFAIVILELYDTHARIVHCWTTNAEQHIELRNSGVTKEKDFYAFCTRKIRDFMKQFHIVHVAIDSQGGGRTISELLHNDKYVEPGEQLIWELDSSSLLWDGKERPTDAESGLHILEMVNFRDGKYTSDANHGMKSDFEQRVLLFPYFDDIETILAGKDDMDQRRIVDTLEDVVDEIDQLRDELMMIVHDATLSGYERWGAPRVKGNIIGEIHDDRYSALLMANSAARRLRQIPKQNTEYVGGAFVGQKHPDRTASGKFISNKTLYVGPAWFTEKAKSTSESYGLVVKHG